MMGSGCGTGSSSGSGCSPGIGSSSGIGARCVDRNRPSFKVGSGNGDNGVLASDAHEHSAAGCDAVGRDSLDRKTRLRRVMPGHAAYVATECERIVLCMCFPSESYLVRPLSRSSRTGRSQIGSVTNQKCRGLKIPRIACPSIVTMEKIKDDQVSRRFGASHRDDRNGAFRRGVSQALLGNKKCPRTLQSAGKSSEKEEEETVSL